MGVVVPGSHRLDDDQRSAERAGREVGQVREQLVHVLPIAAGHLRDVAR